MNDEEKSHIATDPNGFMRGCRCALDVDHDREAGPMNGPACTVHPDEPAVAFWLHPSQIRCGASALPLCQKSLDNWFDRADDDPELEPFLVTWLDGSRRLEGLAR